MNSKKTRKRFTEKERNYHMAAVAYLSSKGKTQMVISEELGLSQTFVSQLIRDAVKAGILKARDPEFVRAEVDDSFLQRIEREFEANQELTAILKKESPSFNQIFVVQDTEFVTGAASVLPSFLSQSVVLGVSFGRTLRELIGAFEGAFLPRLEACIPIQGDPIFWNNQNIATLSSTRLALELKKKLLEGDEIEQFSLIGVPAYISPKRYDEKKVSQFFSDVPGYQAIFDEGGAAERLNAILTGIGIPSPEDEDRRGIFIRERIEQEGIEPAEIARLCYGDLVGLLLPRKGKVTATKRLNTSWTGLRPKTIQDIAALDPETNPGVIVVAKGAAKAEAILASIRGDYVTRIIVDRDLAGALAQLLEAG